MGIIGLARTKKRIEGIITGDDESGKVGQELTSNVEEDEEEVACDNPEDDVDLGDRSLLLEIVKEAIFGQLVKQPLADAAAHQMRGRRVCACEERIGIVGLPPYQAE